MEEPERSLTKTPGLDIPFLARRRIRVQIRQLGASADREFLVEAELSGAGQAWLLGIGWVVKRHNCGV